ncbi:unnamed protein product [Durusdinium trenchii]|uniref:Chloroplastic n=3 Tax=Durusdinium trenchii TaxID=1381693 RepID=A0ABP0QWY4_9DINO
MRKRMASAAFCLALLAGSKAEAPLPSDECEALGSLNCSLSLRQLRASAPSCVALGCHGSYVRGRSCQCTAQCDRHGNCCPDYKQYCLMADIPPETELQLQKVDAFLEEQPRQSFLRHGGLLQTFGSSLGGGNCGDLCTLPEHCPEFGSSKRCRFDVYDNAVAAIYLTKRGKIESARKILDAFLHLLYPPLKIPHVTFGRRDGLPSGRWLTLIGSSYTDSEVKPGIYWGKNVVDGGVDTGNNAWVGLALAQFAAETGESCYLVAAQDILTALKKGADCDDKLLGYMAKLRPYPANYRSTEHNIDVFALAKILGDEDAMNRARVFVQEMFGHNERYPKSFAMGTDGAVPCDTSTMKTAIPADAQFWALLAGVENTKERQVSALEDSLQSVEDGGMLTTDEDLIGRANRSAGRVRGLRFTNWGNGAQWENTASAMMAMSMFQQKYGVDALQGVELEDEIKGIRRSMLRILDTYGSIPASILGGNKQAWKKNEHAREFPGGSDTGIGWTYYRYPHVAANAWLGLALLHQPVEGGPVHQHANPYAVPLKPLPQVEKSLKCLPRKR